MTQTPHLIPVIRWCFFSQIQLFQVGQVSLVVFLLDGICFGKVWQAMNEIHWKVHMIPEEENRIRKGFYCIFNVLLTSILLLTSNIKSCKLIHRKCPILIKRWCLHVFSFRAKWNDLLKLYHWDPEIKFHCGKPDWNKISFRGLSGIILRNQFISPNMEIHVNTALHRTEERKWLSPADQVCYRSNVTLGTYLLCSWKTPGIFKWRSWTR